MLNYRRLGGHVPQPKDQQWTGTIRAGTGFQISGDAQLTTGTGRTRSFGTLGFKSNAGARYK